MTHISENIITRLIDHRKFALLKSILLELNPFDIAEILNDIPKEHVSTIFRLLPKELAAEIFVEMDPEQQENLIKACSDNELRAMMDELYVDDTVDIIEEMPATVVKRILKNISPDMRKSINLILHYPEDSAGSIMTTEYADLKKNMTISEAFSRIRKTGVDKETIYTCYVTDESRHLLGSVSIEKILLSDEDATIESIMEKDILCLNTLDDKEKVARAFENNNLLAVPVSDGENRLVGIITVDDAFDVISEEAEEDFLKMAAMQQSDETYLKTRSFTHAKNRIFWLLILMLSATITGKIITAYEAAFSALPLLASFIPLLMGTGGNCGAQSSTMIIRGLSTEEIKLKDFFKVLFKEFRLSFIISFALIIVNTIRILAQYRLETNAILLSVVMAIAMVCTIFVSNALGCILPMAAKKFKLDPAMMAAPLLTTIVDACSILMFFQIASSIFHI